ncbi:MAG: DUF4864 domain-containing protein [Phyllobacteriaceae bacterium]|nr:DUF4864 domain-containing protein [Phyllobacteriaceae bacterium]
MAQTIAHWVRVYWLMGWVALAASVVPAQAGEAATPPQQSIDGQIRAFLADNFDQAYSYAAPNVRMIFPTVDSFMGMVKGGYQPVYRPKTWDFARTRTEADGTVYQEVLITDLSGQNWAALYTVQQQPDGSWKITGVSLRKSDAVSM